jgi:hypothetical protein
LKLTVKDILISLGECSDEILLCVCSLNVVILLEKFKGIKREIERNDEMESKKNCKRNEQKEEPPHLLFDFYSHHIKN